MGLFHRQMVDLYPARLDQLRSGAAADVQHGREHRVQPQGGHGGGEQLPLRCREGRDLVRLQQTGGHLCAPRLTQLPADELCRRFQREHIGCARRIGRQQDIAQRLALEGKPHQAAQIVLVRRKRRTGQRPALQLYAAHRTLAVAVLRLQTEHPALGLGPAAVKTPAVPHTGTPQCRPGKILFPVAEKCRVPGYAAGKSRIGKILDMPHKVAFLIVAGGHKAPHRTGCRINRMRHCSPARPAGRP